MRAIAIDGPSGAGKSSMARRLAQELGYIYVDTGALYRAIALYCLNEGIAPDDTVAVPAALEGLRIEIGYRGGVQRVFLNGRDVSEEIRGQEVSMAASKVSAMPQVRAFLFDLQRDLARRNNVVMDGRDIGTVVLPEADVKIFLTASVEERARRRLLEYAEKGKQADYEVLLAEMRQRDENDRTRAVAPLKKAEDAVEVDTTALDFEAAMARFREIIKEKLS